MKKAKLIVNDYDTESIESISARFNLTQISSRILLNRNLCTEEEIGQFLTPDFKYFEDARNYKDLEKGCERILRAIEKGEKIIIYGDYDVDGVTSISQFVILLKGVGAKVSYYVPEREDEGYGISSSFVEKVSSGEIAMDLLITVDCGIAEVERVRQINNLNKDVIILDHHQCGDEIPEAYAVINPKQKDCPSKNKQLCASGLSFKFLRYLNSMLKVEGVEDKLLELACLGTVADIVDLKGDNRIITYNGLKLINDTKIIGLKKLIEASGISGKKIESYHIGFILAPRINASGRMSSAKKAVRLMLTQDEAEAEELASELEELNALRKKTEQEIFVQAVSKIDGDSLHKKNVIVVYGTDWHEGVLGIVASKLTEKFEKPAVVISVKDGMGRGSARSLDYLDIYEALKHVDGYLVKYGGHKLAAGLSICMKDINQFISELNRYAGTAAGSSGEFKELQVDALIGCQDITNRLYEEINMFEPYGHGNTKPVFAVKNASLCNIKKVGKEGNHISFHLYDSAKDVPVIGFDKISILEKVLTRPLSYIVSINNNEFKGVNNLQLILQNVEETDEFDYTIDENKSKILNSLINKSKSKIIKTDLFKLVEKINTAYNTKTTAEEILCMLKKKGDIQYVLKDDILYIKR